MREILFRGKRIDNGEWVEGAFLNDRDGAFYICPAASDMSLDITFKERKEFRCPDCGWLVMSQDIDAECSSGQVWYDFLESIGYYVPYEKRTEGNDWYGEDMVLTEKQTKQLADFVSDNKPYNARDIECLVARALRRGSKVVINADW